MKYNDIIKLAQKCKTNVETKKTASVTTTKNYTALADLFSKTILRINETGKPSDAGIRAVKQNPKPQKGWINGGIGINNCIKLCELMVNWVNKHNEAPAYLAYTVKDKKYKISVWAWAYATANILIHYNKYKKFPTKQLVTEAPFKKPEPPKPEPKPGPTFKKYGHSDEYGCDDMGQNTDYYCGCHSLQEVFRNLTDIVVDQDTIASVCGTTYDGTDHPGLNTCVAWFNRTYGKNLSVEWKNFSELGWDGIRNIVNSNNQDCVIHNLYRNQYGHYEVVNWVGDDYVGVQNSLGDRCNRGCFCGYKEDRTQSEFRSYISGISQKSVMVITNDG